MILASHPWPEPEPRYVNESQEHYEWRNAPAGNVTTYTLKEPIRWSWCIVIASAIAALAASIWQLA